MRATIKKINKRLPRLSSGECVQGVKTPCASNQTGFSNYSKFEKPHSAGQKIIFGTLRIGHGYDVHRLKEGRKLILGGVEIPYEKGLDGHSDADVLLHAVMDAMLGAAALGDIGRHFPDTDGAYKDIDSMILLKNVRQLVADRGYRLSNLDVTVIAQRPKLAAYLPEMIEGMARTLAVEPEQINIKATTEEHLGFTGSGEGIACHAVCILAGIDN